MVKSDNIYGNEWLNFIQNCKAMLGVESGSSICDFTGEIQKNVENHLKKNPAATFEELRDLYFKVDGRYSIQVISALF